MHGHAPRPSWSVIEGRGVAKVLAQWAQYVNMMEEEAAHLIIEFGLIFLPLTFLSFFFTVDMGSAFKDWLKIVYVIFAFCSAFSLGALKSVLVGPIAGLIIIIGNVGVILGLFPFHVTWTVYTLAETNRLDAPLKVAFLFGLPALFAIWLALSIAGSIVVGVGYGFFTPWVSSFEAFRHENERFRRCIVDGTWETIKGSCTVVRDFADLCYHSYPTFLKERRECSSSEEVHTLRLLHVPGCIIVGILGLAVEIPLYTAIAIVKSPYMLFKGWHRLIHDLITREGPFLETACIPIAGLTIILWPVIVIGSIIMAIFSSFFIGLYGAVIVFQEKSFGKGVAYVIAMVAEFDEYTNDWLYLREGTVLPRPRYRKKGSHSSELSIGANRRIGGRVDSVSGKPRGILVPTLAPSRSVRETIQEVKVIQIWENMMKSCEMRGQELLDANVITTSDLYEWLRAENSDDAAVIGVGLPCYSLLQNLLFSIKSGSAGFVMLDGVEVTNLNVPQDRLLDWFFQPVMVLKDQIRAIGLGEGEVRYLEKLIILGGNAQQMKSWNNGGLQPEDAVRAAQIQGITRRMIGMVRSVSKFPTYRRRYRSVVKALIAYSLEKNSPVRSCSLRSVASI